jgi:hypothetical protein
MRVFVAAEAAWPFIALALRSIRCVPLLRWNRYGEFSSAIELPDGFDIAIFWQALPFQRISPITPLRGGALACDLLIFRQPACQDAG